MADQMETGGLPRANVERMTESVEAPNIELVKHMESKLQNVHPKQRGTIYRVPQVVLNTGPDAYKPRVVSIGPYHHHYQQHHLSDDKLEDMEEHKWLYLDDFLRRNSNCSLQDCIHAIRGLEGKARDCYSEKIDMQPDQFVEIMVLDGCFLIELFLKQYFGAFRKDDPVYTISWLVVRIAYDILLFENQLPFFITQCLFNLCADNVKSSSLQMLAMSFFRRNVRMNREILEDNLASTSIGEVHHLLHLFYLNVRNITTLPPKPSLLTKIIDSFSQTKGTEANLPTTQKPSTCQYLRPVPCVKRLIEAGIKFKSGRGIGILDISFRDGVLEIPHFYIEDSVNAFIRNLCVLEQLYPEFGNHFILYTIFLSFVIDTAEDVEILRRHGIIEHTLGSDEKVAELFNWASNGTSIRSCDNYLSNVCEQVNVYCQRRLHVWRAKLMRDYFGNPWAILSLFAALFLLGLAVVQSLFSILQYCFQSNRQAPPPY